MVLLGKITRGWDCGLGSPRCAGRASYRGMVIHRWLLYEQRQHLGAWSQFSLAAPATGTWQHSDTTRPRSDRALSKNTLRIHLRRVATGVNAPRRKVVACWRVDPLFRTRRPRAQSSYEYVTNCELISNLWLRPPWVDAHATTHPTAALAPAPWRCSQTPRECPPPGPAPVLPPRGTQVVMGP